MGGEGGDGGERFVIQGPATDFGIEGDVLDLERGFDVRHEMGEVFVEDVGEKAVLGSLSAFDLIFEGVDGLDFRDMFTFLQRSLCEPLFLVSLLGGNVCSDLFERQV